jgi:hypothetical protein
MIVDAGGGTIDLSAYFMTFSPPSFEEIAPAECESKVLVLQPDINQSHYPGRLQGSIFVSRRARAFLESKSAFS